MLVPLLLFYLAVAARASKEALQQQCPKQFLNSYDEYYLQVRGQTCYRFVTDKILEYTKAAEECQDDGGFLAMPKTERLDYFLRFHLNNTYNCYVNVWIGLSDRLEEGDFKWEDGHRFYKDNFSSFEEGFSLSHYYKDCVYMDPVTGTWYEEHCSDGMFPFFTLSHPLNRFVCQYTKNELESEESFVDQYDNDNSVMTTGVPIVQNDDEDDEDNGDNTNLADRNETTTGVDDSPLSFPADEHSTVSNMISPNISEHNSNESFYPKPSTSYNDTVGDVNGSGGEGEDLEWADIESNENTTINIVPTKNQDIQLSTTVTPLPTSMDNGSNFDKDNDDVSGVTKVPSLYTQSNNTNQGNLKPSSKNSGFYDDESDDQDTPSGSSSEQNDDFGDEDFEDIKQAKDECPDFYCDEVSCGMRGYQKDERGCQICRCNGVS